MTLSCRLNGERIRISNIDAPETFRAKCAREYALGIASRDSLARLLAAGVPSVHRTGMDRYGRTLATLRVCPAGENPACFDAGEKMIEAGHAVRWPERFDGCAR